MQVIYDPRRPFSMNRPVTTRVHFRVWPIAIRENRENIACLLGNKRNILGPPWDAGSLLCENNSAWWNIHTPFTSYIKIRGTVISCKAHERVTHGRIIKGRINQITSTAAESSHSASWDVVKCTLSSTHCDLIIWLLGILVPFHFWWIMPPPPLPTGCRLALRSINTNSLVMWVLLDRISFDKILKPGLMP